MKFKFKPTNREAENIARNIDTFTPTENFAHAASKLINKSEGLLASSSDLSPSDKESLRSKLVQLFREHGVGEPLDSQRSVVTACRQTNDRVLDVIYFSITSNLEKDNYPYPKIGPLNFGKLDPIGSSLLFTLTPDELLFYSSYKGEDRYYSSRGRSYYDRTEYTETVRVASGFDSIPILRNDGLGWTEFKSESVVTGVSYSQHYRRVHGTRLEVEWDRVPNGRGPQGFREVDTSWNVPSGGFTSETSTTLFSPVAINNNELTTYAMWLRNSDSSGST